MIGQCLGAWLTYVHGRRVEHQMKGVASEHHNLVLMVKVFGRWKSRFVRARQLADFQESIAIKGQLAILRRAMWKWKFCILMKAQSSNIKVNSEIIVGHKSIDVLLTLLTSSVAINNTLHQVCT